MVKCKLCHSTTTLRSYRVRQYQYYRCTNCYALFLHPFPKVQPHFAIGSVRGRSIELSYQNYSYENGLIEEQRIRKQAKKILAKLRALNQKGKTLLDIGAGYGFFLDEANKTGLKTTGIEPSKKLFVSINQLIDTRVINLSFDRFYRLNKYKEYDFISIIHVVEHVVDPIKMIQHAVKLLKPSGVLYIETPNLNSHLFNSEKAHYTFLTPPDHLWIFSQKSFDNIFKTIPVSINQLIDTYSYPEHFMGILKDKLQIINNPFEKAQGKQFQINNKYQKLNDKSDVVKIIKYTLYDKLIAPLFTPFLNISGYGSILGLYIKKK